MSWLGTSPQSEGMALRVEAVRDEAAGIRSFELRHPGTLPLPPFEAGAHLRVEVELSDARTAQRPYSLLGDPSDGSRYRIAVLLEPDGRGGSRFLHERIRRGSTLRVLPPENDFPLLPEPAHAILIAGGIGITPILSMVRTLERQGRDYELHYVARTSAAAAFLEEIEALAQRRAHFYFSRGERPRPLDLEVLLSTLGPEAHVYVCGPPRMIRATRTWGETAGWQASRIHAESFGPKRRSGDRAVEVRLQRSELTVRVEAGETILDAILNAGVWAPYECRRGECSSCMTRVVAGNPDHRDICLSAELRETYLCPCVSRARSPHLTLDL